MADFELEPLSRVAASLAEGTASASERERAVLIAERPGPVAPYALPVDLPGPSHSMRAQGLALLWARAASVAAAVVGTCRLRLVCEFDETFVWLEEEFRKHPDLTAHLAQYGGPFSLVRGLATEVPADFRAMPFRAGQSCIAPHGVPPETGAPRGTPSSARGAALFVGVDWGRSDVKCAVVDAAGEARATYVTRWWRPKDASARDLSERVYLDPASLTDISEPLRCLGEAALDAVRKAIWQRAAESVGSAAGVGSSSQDDGITICGLGMSAAGCVQDGRLCGVPPAFAGCDAAAAASVVSRLERAVLDYVCARLASSTGSDARVHPACASLLVNDGDASAMWGAPGLGDKCGGSHPGDGSAALGLFLSCGTGLAGGIACTDGSCCGGGVLELGKLIVGLPREPGAKVPIHDTLKLPGVAQGVAGTQRSFFNLLEARTGQRVEGKAEQRAAIVAMQERPLDDEVVAIFGTLGTWLAQFVLELSEYLPFTLSHVEAGGKLTDGKPGEIMLSRAREVLAEHGIESVQRADESEFGQALAVAQGVRASHSARTPAGPVVEGPLPVIAASQIAARTATAGTVSIAPTYAALHGVTIMTPRPESLSNVYNVSAERFAQIAAGIPLTPEEMARMAADAVVPSADAQQAASSAVASKAGAARASTSPLKAVKVSKKKMARAVKSCC